jgi:uncharacterized protein (DUF1778 family)
MNAITQERPFGAATKKRRDIQINMRLPRQVLHLIDTAAEAVSKTRSDFILESARQHAIDVLLDQRYFVLDADQFADFVQQLDAPPVGNEKLKKLMARKAPWAK